MHVLAPTTMDLEQLRARLAAVARLDSPLIVADQHGLIRHVDVALARDLEWQLDDLVGRPLTVIIPRRFHDAHHLGFSRFLTTGERVVLERPLALWVATRTGGELRVEHVITAIRRHDGWLFGAAIRTRGTGND